MPPRPERVVLLRHGETEWSRAGRHTGRTDVDLTDAGRRQAQAAGARLRGERFALVLTSPLRRARDTCALAGFGDAEVDADLAEWDYGDYEGRTAAEVRTERPGWSPWSGGFPGGESVDRVGARADAVLARLRAVDGAVLLVAHGHLLRILAARWLGLEAAQGALLVLTTASVSALGWEREQAAIRLWNDVSHLREAP